MSRVILITGGCRSGKSAFAQTQAERLPGRRLYVATGTATDEEMRARIASHQQARRAGAWDLREEPLNLVQALHDSREYPVVLVDCLTFWIGNLMFAASRSGKELDETQAAQEARAVFDTCRSLASTVFFVTNEVGWGIVPDNALARRYRDLIGRCNQIFAAEAETAVLVTCGIPQTLKGTLP